MKENESIESVMFPDSGTLVINNHTATATIVDEELDPVECTFNYDGCVEIDTKGYTHLTLSIGNLYELIELIEQAEDHYDGLTDDQWNEVD